MIQKIQEAMKKAVPKISPSSALVQDFIRYAYATSPFSQTIIAVDTTCPACSCEFGFIIEPDRVICQNCGRNNSVKKTKEFLNGDKIS